MTIKIKYKIIFSVVITSAVFTFIISFFLISKERNKEIMRLNEKIENTTELFKSINIDPLYKLDERIIRLNAESIFKDPEIVGLKLSDKFKFITINLKKYNDPGSKKIKKRIIFEFDGRKDAVAEITFTDQLMRKRIESKILDILFLISGLLFLNVIVILLLSHILSKPIDTIINGLMHIDSGNFDHELKLSTGDEFDKIEIYFNKMAKTIKNEIEKRKRREQELNEEIIERKNIEKELSNTRNYLSNVFNSLQSMLISVNSDGVITQWNIAAEKYTGISSMEAVSKKIWDILPFLEKYREKLDIVITSNSVQKIHEKEIIVNDNEYFDISFSPLLFNGSKGAVIRIDNITELEKKDAQLRQAQKMESIGTLAGGLAHDFNNVLGGIIGSLSILKFKLANPDSLSDEEIDKYINIMEESGMRASDIVNQLLTLSRKQELSFSSVDLNSVIENVVKICKNSFDKSIEIIMTKNPDPAIIKADQGQIEQTLLNLCINSSHAMTMMRDNTEHYGGRLDISIEKINVEKNFKATHPESEEIDYWIVSVRDTGVGMDKKTLAKMFDPFFTTKEKGVGTGLGLAMVYNIIKQHRGFIDVYSELKIGTTINFYLPVYEDEEVLKKNEEKTNDVYTSSGTVLVVDDEEIMRIMAKDILMLCGFNVVFASNGQEAVDIYRENRDEIKLVLLDMVMPVKSGKETFIELKKIKDDIRVILSSGFKKDERIESILNLGVKGFVQKPYTVTSLTKIIKEALMENLEQNKSH